MAAIGTVAGAFVAFHLVPVGEDANRIAGIVAAGYIGGGVNFVAVARAVQFDDPSQFSALLAAESMVGIGYLMFLVALPATRLYLRLFPGSAGQPADSPASRNDVIPEQHGMASFDVVFGISLSLLIVALSNWVSGLLGVPHLLILFVTVFAAAAQAAAQGWHGLVTPGLLVGVLGYVVGTFLGLAVANVLG